MAVKYAQDELNKCSRQELIHIVLQQQSQLEKLNDNLEKLIEQIRIAAGEKLSFTQAALGGKININTIEGPYEYDLQPGTQNNTKITLKGKGVPTLRNKSVRGNHYVTLSVEVPENLTEEQKQVLAKVNDPYGVEVRAATDSLGGFTFGSHKKKRKRI